MPTDVPYPGLRGLVIGQQRRYGPTTLGNSQMFNLYLISCQPSRILQSWSLEYIPFIVNCLDDESQCWTDSIDILIHDLFNDCRLSGIVKSTVADQLGCGRRATSLALAYSIKILISLSLSLAFLRIDNIFAVSLLG